MQVVIQVVFVAVFVTAALAWEESEYKRRFPKPVMKKEPSYYYGSQNDDRPKDWKPSNDNKGRDYYYYDSQDYEQRDYDYNNEYYYPSQPRVPDSTNSGYAYDTQYYEPRSANPQPVLELNGNLKLYGSRRRNSPFLNKLTRQDYYW